MSATDGSGEPRASGDEPASDASGGLPLLSPEQLAQLMFIAHQSTPQHQRVLGGGGLGGLGGAFSSGSPLIPPPGQPPDGYAGLFSQTNFGGGGGGLGAAGGRGVSFSGGGGASGGVSSGGVGGHMDLPSMFARLQALERAMAADTGDRPRAASPVGSVAASQASTMSQAVPVASLLDAIGRPDEEFQFGRQKHLSRGWHRKLKEAKLALNASSTLAAVDALSCVGRALLRIMWAAGRMLEAGAGDAERRALEESLVDGTEAEQELSTMFSLLTVLCSKTLGPHATVLADAARFARRTDGGLSCLDDNAVPDPFFADVLANAFKKLSEQSLKEIYAKDKSGKKVSTDDDEAAGTDLRKELAAAKKQLEKANNKLAGLGRQNGRKEDLSGAKSKKDDKPKPKPRDKDTAPSSEGAAQ
jgi:hypothetical protein